jgi:sulfide:quinone oxidoreductase
MAVPLPPSPPASEVLLAAFAERGIAWHPERTVSRLEPARHVARLADGGEIPYDLFLGVPVHRPPEVVLESGMTVDGWIPVDPLTLETSFPDVFAVGDVTSVGTPKAGIFAEGQAAVVADAIVARARRTANGSEYGGRGICYIEWGGGEVAKVDVTFRSGQTPVGVFDPASRSNAADKRAFGRDRIQRWFDRTWP